MSLDGSEASLTWGAVLKLGEETCRVSSQPCDDFKHIRPAELCAVGEAELNVRAEAIDSWMASGSLSFLKRGSSENRSASFPLSFLTPAGIGFSGSRPCWSKAFSGSASGLAEAGGFQRALGWRILPPVLLLVLSLTIFFAARPALSLQLDAVRGSESSEQAELPEFSHLPELNSFFESSRSTERFERLGKTELSGRSPHSNRAEDSEPSSHIQREFWQPFEPLLMLAANNEGQKRPRNAAGAAGAAESPEEDEGGSARLRTSLRPGAAELRRARNAFEYGDFENAAEILREVDEKGLLFSEQERVEAYRLLGLSLFYLGDRSGASNAFFDLLKQNPDYQLDPFYVPPHAVAFFDEVKRDSESLLAPIRERRTRRLMEERAEEEARQEAQRRRQEQLAREPSGEEDGTFVVRLIERRVAENSRLVAWMPFGLGQFQNGHRVVGTTLLVSEALTAAVSLLSYWSIEGLRDQRTGKYSAPAYEIATRLDAVKFISAALFYGLWAGGVIDANIRFVPTRTLSEGPTSRGDEPGNGDLGRAPAEGRRGELRDMRTEPSETGGASPEKSRRGGEQLGDSKPGSSDARDSELGDRNSGVQKSGDQKSGDRNSGDRNSEEQDLGDLEFEGRNSGVQDSRTQDSLDRDSLDQD